VSKFGTVGWIGLGVYVATFDALAPETLSHAVDRALEHPIGKVAVPLAIGTVAGHLMNVFPESIDPITRTVGFLRDTVSNLMERDS